MTKKLSLHRDTIRNLDDKELDRVNGAIECTGPRPDTCAPTHYPDGAICIGPIETVRCIQHTMEC